MSAKPITPQDARKNKAATFPDEVIAVFNELIAREFDGQGATVKQQEAARMIADRMKVTTDQVYARHWLDVEDAFRTAGWEVEYDKPGYNESYEATFEFKPKRRTT